MQNLTEKEITEILKEVLVDKKKNLVKLLFDLYYTRLRVTDVNNEKKEIDDKIMRYQGQIDLERAKPAKLKDKAIIVGAQTEMKNLEVQKARLLQKASTERIEEFISENKKLNEVLESCIKNPNIILNQDVKPRIK